MVTVASLSDRIEKNEVIFYFTFQVIMFGNGMGMFQLISQNGADEGRHFLSNTIIYSTLSKFELGLRYLPTDFRFRHGMSNQGQISGPERKRGENFDNHRKWG